MTTVINGSSPSITFSDSTTQTTSAVVGGKVPYSIMPTGSVLQVVNATYLTSTSTSSTTYTDTGLTATITPLFSTSKIAVIICQTLSPTTAASNTYGSWRVLRGATEIYQDARINMYMQFAHSDYTCYVLDSPATTSATTYKAQMLTGSALYTLEAQHASLRQSTIMLMEIAP